MIGLVALVLGCGSETKEPRVPDPPVDTAPPAGPAALVFDGERPTNVLFLSIDTLRADHVTPDLMPFVSQLAAEGVALQDHVQCSNWTFDSVSCTLTGQTPVERGHLPRLNGTELNRLPVPPENTLLAERLTDAGWTTIGASNNAWFGPNWGNTQGYQVFDPSPGAGAGVWGSVSSALSGAQASGAAERWFVHAHFLEPHAAYESPEGWAEGLEDLPPWPHGDLRIRPHHYEQRDAYADLPAEERDLLEQHLRLMYAGEVRWLDHQLGQFFADADSRGWLDDTLVVVWTDHGEQFWEHGKQTHAYALHGEENDGVAIFWAKNLQPAVWTAPTHAVDLVPTVLDAIGLPVPEELGGRVVGTATDDRVRFSSTLARSGGVQTVQQGRYRLHFYWRSGKLELYDRWEDPGETNDLWRPGHPQGMDLWDKLKPVAEIMASLVIGADPQPTWPPGL